MKGNCYPVANLANCSRANSAVLCDICKEGFVLIDRKCIAGTIDNCEDYGNEKLYVPERCDMCGPLK